MKYMLLIHQGTTPTPGTDAWEHLSEAQRAEAYEGYVAVSRDAQAAGALVDASELEETSAATSVRVRNGEALVTDGPYAEVKESLGGYYLFSCGVRFVTGHRRPLRRAE